MATVFSGQKPHQKANYVGNKLFHYPQLKLDIEKYVLNFITSVHDKTKNI